MAKDKATLSVELVKEHLVALEREAEGYAARLAAATAGRVEKLTVEQLEDRANQVAEQVKHYKGLLGKDKKGS